MTDREDDRRIDAETREAKLAQALRANLRRRKATGSAPPAHKPQRKTSD